MRRADFEAMVRGMAAGFPPEALLGITGIEVTAKTVPHPVREGIWTLGECIPHASGGPDDEGPTITSRVELHYGSFLALSRVHQGFDWRHEAWETLTHEVRHHLEWRARVPELEALDDAAEANYARVDGDPFDPLFHLAGEKVAPGITRVEDDIFIDAELGRGEWRAASGARRGFAWHGRAWSVTLPDRLPDVLFLALAGVDPEPAGDLILVLRRRAGMLDLFRKPSVEQARAVAHRTA
jgi:hypothetical protein